MDGQMASRRYAVLHHTGVEHPHFDLLFERDAGSALVAFRLERWPALPGDEAVELPDHRRVYLTYEGEISGNRGQVRRVAGGVARVGRWEGGWVVGLEGVRVVLEQDEGGWRLRG